MTKQVRWLGHLSKIFAFNLIAMALLYAPPAGAQGRLTDGRLGKASSVHDLKEISERREFH
jgi:hypothetical protein